VRPTRARPRRPRSSRPPYHGQRRGCRRPGRESSPRRGNPTTPAEPAGTAACGWARHSASAFLATEHYCSPRVRREVDNKKKDQLKNRCKLACLLAAAGNLATAGVAHQVRTESGTISGIGANGVSVYKGVPFAAPPVGDLRWRPPMPAAAWTGTRKADAFAPACMQVGVSMPGETPPAVSEDCLYLNIWTPPIAHTSICR